MRNGSFLIGVCRTLIWNHPFLIWGGLSLMRNSPFLLQVCFTTMTKRRFLIPVWLLRIRERRLTGVAQEDQRGGFCRPGRLFTAEKATRSATFYKYLSRSM